MDEVQCKAIRKGFWDGLTEQQIADSAGVTLEQVNIYLFWWCDRGCPPGGHGLMPTGSSEGQDD